jgi:hypothetical protein
MDHGKTGKPRANGEPKHTKQNGKSKKTRTDVHSKLCEMIRWQAYIFWPQEMII